MIGAHELALMKQSAVLVNTARGPVIDEPALVEAMTSGRLRGAGLDVFWEEPPPSNSPLFRAPNILLTPHTAGGSRDVVAKSFALAFENIHRLRDGRQLINRVDGGDPGSLEVKAVRHAPDSRPQRGNAPDTTN